jgi:peptidoglycan/xylan/chitin deacetylase (PgdA/CDA1 family)
MDLTQSQERRSATQRRRRRARARGLLALCVLIAIVAGAAVAASGGSGGPASGGSAAGRGRGGAAAGARHGTRPHGATGGRGHRAGATAEGGAATGVPGSAHVPVLMYHVINPPPAGAPYPGLYVPADEFAAQMHALKAAGWHAVTLDQLWAYWRRGVPLGPGKPIVITFDNGYLSQYTNALPVLERLHWQAVENIQLQGLPPSQGGLTTGQVRGLIRAGWELDTQGISHADLPALSAAELRYQVATARRILQHRYHVPVEWFCYPSGQYNATVIAEVKAAGYRGSTTVIPGWASPTQDPYTMPRLRVLGGTSPQALLAQIAAAQGDAPPPASDLSSTP